MISGHVQQWLACRWSWLRPRTVPMIVAFVGMLGVLGATKYLPVLSYVDQPVQRAWRCVDAPAAGDQPQCQTQPQIEEHGRSPGSLHLTPPRHGRGTAITVDR